MSSNNYEFRPVTSTPDRLKDYSQFLRLVFPKASHCTENYLKWQYQDNPEGKVVGWDALSCRKLAAHYVVIPFRALIQGQSTLGLLSLNTATHPEHQGKGLFTQLANKTFQSAAEAGYRFVVGVANANSTPGFVRKLGFTAIAPLSVKVFPSAVYCSPKTQAKAKTRRVQFEHHWSPESMKWRLQNPAGKYSYDRGWITCPSGQPLLKMFMGQTSENSAQIGNQAGFKPLGMWIGLDPYFENLIPQMEFPKFLRPSPLNLIWKSLSNNSTQSAVLPVPDRGEIRFNLLDFDAY